MEYLLFKLVHIFAVVIFLGNITLGIFWKAHADSSKSPQIMQHTMAGIIKADRIFTLPAIVIILIGGFGAAIVGGVPILRTGWIFWSIVLFSISGYAFSAQVAPLQRKLLEVASAGVQSGSIDWKQYSKHSSRWLMWGAVALIAPFIAAILMILKPSLPSFWS